MRKAERLRAPPACSRTTAGTGGRRAAGSGRGAGADPLPVAHLRAAAAVGDGETAGAPADQPAPAPGGRDGRWPRVSAMRAVPAPPTFTDASVATTAPRRRAPVALRSVNLA